MADLESELQDQVHGVGEQKARDIVEVVAQHGESGLSESDRQNLKSGIDYVENGQPEYAMKFFRRVEL